MSILRARNKYLRRRSEHFSGVQKCRSYGPTVSSIFPEAETSTSQRRQLPPNTTRMQGSSRDAVSRRGHLLRLLVRDLDVEGLLDGHDQLHGVQAVRTWARGDVPPTLRAPLTCEHTEDSAIPAHAQIEISTWSE